MSRISFKEYVTLLYSENPKAIFSYEWPETIVVLVKALCNQKFGREHTYEEIELALYREGFLSSKYYEMPEWFCRKWKIK